MSALPPSPSMLPWHFSTLPSGLVIRTLSHPAPRARLFFLHGYGDHSGRYDPLAEFLHAEGFSLHAVDLPGQGRSPGNRGYVPHWSAYPQALASALAPLPTDLPLFLLAHSHGALVALHTVLSPPQPIPHLSGLILVSPFFAPAFRIPLTKRLVARVANYIAPALRIPTGLSARQMTSDTALAQESAQDPLLARIATPRWYFGCMQAQRLLPTLVPAFPPTLPVLTLLSPHDQVSSPLAARTIHASLPTPPSPQKTLLEYPHLHHELLRESTRLQVLQDLLAWLNKQLPR